MSFEVNDFGIPINPKVKKDIKNIKAQLEDIANGNSGTDGQVWTSNGDGTASFKNSTGGSGNASGVAVTDSGNYYTGNNVETVLQEVGSSSSNINNKFDYFTGYDFVGKQTSTSDPLYMIIILDTNGITIPEGSTGYRLTFDVLLPDEANVSAIGYKIARNNSSTPSVSGFDSSLRSNTTISKNIITSLDFTYNVAYDNSTRYVQFFLCGTVENTAKLSRVFLRNIHAYIGTTEIAFLSINPFANDLKSSVIRTITNKIFNDKLVSGSNIQQFTGLYNAYKAKKFNFLGDSITAGYSATVPFAEIVRQYLDLCIARNYGVNGDFIAKQSTDDTTCMSVRYTAMSDDADGVFVLGGTNDFGTGVASIGTMSDTTAETFYGALKVLIEGLLSKYPAGKIIFCTPPHRGGSFYSGDVTAEYRTSKNWNLSDFVTAIKTVCAYYGIPVFDLYSLSGLQPSVDIIRTNFMPDSLHPNDAGHAIIGKKVASYINSQ